MTVAGHIIKVTPNRAIHNIGLNSCISEDNSVLTKHICKNS